SLVGARGSDGAAQCPECGRCTGLHPDPSNTRSPELWSILIGAGPCIACVLGFMLSWHFAGPGSGDVVKGVGVLLLFLFTCAAICAPGFAFSCYRTGSFGSPRRWKRGIPVLVLSYGLIGAAIILLCVYIFFSALAHSGGIG